ncbi:LOW QUALITY PROTEIN: conserved hypothetical protein, partial [Brucella sp. 83/13]
RKASVWDRLLEVVSEACYGDIVMIDSTCVRVHQQRPPEKKGMAAWGVPAADLPAISTCSLVRKVAPSSSA